MEAQVVILIVGLMIAFLPFGRTSASRIQSVQTGSNVMRGIVAQANSFGFQPGDCSF